MKITEMIRVCIADKTEEVLKARIEELQKPDEDLFFTWNDFLLIKNGERKLLNDFEVEVFYQIVDSGSKKFSLSEWYRAAAICRGDNQQQPSTNGDSSH